ncbi:hypothetical protein G7Y79_00022g052970 [Physcia stellaris]|nr:hypothetical protein G7Y79_00022g052970 [Physcia stellaris]
MSASGLPEALQTSRQRIDRWHAAEWKAGSQVTLASDAPKWVMPTIRHLCRALGAPAAPHHVYAGVSSILTLPAPRVDEATTTEEPGNLNISALIIVVYLLVVTRLTGNEMPAREFTRLRGLAIASIKDSNITEAVEEVADSDHVILSIAGWMRDIGVKGWTELDWFANVGEGTGLGLAEAVSDDEGNDSEIEKAGHRGTNSIAERVDLDLDDEDLSILKPGLGTMMQDRVDYLSESNMREYQAWKKDILLRCDEIENARKMDLSAD